MENRLDIIKKPTLAENEYLELDNNINNIINFSNVNRK